MLTYKRVTQFLCCGCVGFTYASLLSEFVAVGDSLFYKIINFGGAMALGIVVMRILTKKD
jgi:hypothetical protein